jgi:O-antigen/teichoic acid export membrane protein
MTGAVSSTTAIAPPALSRRAGTLRGDFVWTFFGNGVYAACQWAILVLLARIGTPELVGRYAFAIAVVTPVITFANMQLRSVQVTDLKTQYEFRDYLAFRLWSMGAALLVLSALCVLLHYPRESSELVGAVSLSLAVEAVSDCFYGLMQAHSRMDRVAKSMIGRALLSTAAMGVTVYYSRSLTLGVLAMTAVRIAVLAFYDLGRGVRGLSSDDVRRRDCVRSAPRFIHSNQFGILRLAASVGIVSMLVSLNTSIPRYFIEWSEGPRALGIFSALSVFQSTGNLITGALGQAAFVRLATAHLQESPRYFIALLGKLLAVGIGLGCAGIVVALLAGRTLLTHLYGAAYGERSDLLVFLMIATALGYLAQFVGFAVTATRMFALQVPLTLGVAATLTLGCYLLVPGRGTYGAILALLIAMGVNLTGYFAILLVRLRNRHNLEARCA